MSEPLVIVGNGMAAARLVDELAKVALGRYAIAVVGDEPRLAYNCVLLSSVLAGETASHDIELRPASWWRDRGVTLKYGSTATEIDVGRREIKIAGEESIAFSKLVLATGSYPFVPPEVLDSVAAEAAKPHRAGIIQDTWSRRIRPLTGISPPENTIDSIVATTSIGRIWSCDLAVADIAKPVSAAMAAVRASVR